MSASVELVCIAPHQVRTIWPRVRDRLHRAVKKTDLNHTLDIERDLFEGDGLLWLAMRGMEIDAAAVTLLMRTDRNLVCVVTACGGEEMENWLPLLAEIEAWAKAEGAAKVRIIGRRGWVRALPSYRVSNVVLERLL